MASGQHALPPSPPSGSQHWEGDGTLHAYCYDYMLKRGWLETARSFARDAGIKEEEWTGPPIEAPQGLLYEWWSVFWDVFIARSQKTGMRNVNADAYVEAMRRKQEPLMVHFAGQPNMPPQALPRSLAHPPRPLPPGGDPRFVGAPPGVGVPPGQLRLLQDPNARGPLPPQQPQQPGMGPPRQGGPPPQQQLQPQSPHLSNINPPYGNGRPPPQGPNPQQQPPRPGGGPQLQQQQQPQSPHLSNMAAPPYGNGRPLGMLPQQGGPGMGQPQPGQGRPPPGMVQVQGNSQPPQQGGMVAQVFLNGMQAIGLGGRNFETLTPEEQDSLHAHLRKTGALPPTPQQGYRAVPQQQQPPPGPPQQNRGQVRMHPDQQRIQQQGQFLQQQQHQQQQHQQAQAQAQQLQMQNAFAQQQAHTQQQNRAHAEAMARQQQAQQQQAQQRAMQQSNGGPMGYPQVGSPPSPVYSASGASPYTAGTPIPHHMLPPPQNHLSHQPNQPASPPPSFSPPQNARNATLPGKGRGGGGGASVKMSPANSKRGNVDDPSPRSRKRARGGVKEEDTPETPRFDLSGPSSPSTSMGLPPSSSQNVPTPAGQPYRPSASPLPQDSSNARVAFEQALQQGPHQGGGRMIGQPSGEDYGGPNGNGTISRPGSSASNYLNLSAYTNNGTNGPDHKPSPSATTPVVSPHPPPSSSLPIENGGNNSTGGSPAFHLSLPPPPSSFQLNGNDITPGGRPFATHQQPLTSSAPTPQSSSQIGGPPQTPILPPTPQLNGNSGADESGSMMDLNPPSSSFHDQSNDPFADLSGDFSTSFDMFESFINPSIFDDKDLSV